jgi:hypothetical protein
LGITYHPKEKANTTAECLKNQFTPHDLSDESYERRLEARVQAMTEAVDLEKLVVFGTENSLWNSWHSTRMPQAPSIKATDLFNHCIRLSWKEANVITLHKSDNYHNFPPKLTTY